MKTFARTLLSLNQSTGRNSSSAPGFGTFSAAERGARLLAALMLLTFVSVRNHGAAVPFEKVASIFNERCLDCHAAQDPEANFVMESFDALMKGGESGPAILPGKAEESLLVKMVEGRIEKDGKKKIMPPGKRTKLTSEEIAAIRGWIDEGAQAPANAQIASKEIKVPRISAKGTPPKRIGAIASVTGKSEFAMARFNEIEIRSAENRRLLRTITGATGPVNGLVFSADGKRLFSAGGDSGLPGEVKEWNAADGALVRSYSGHKDAVYGIALSPDGKLLATGSYDQKVKLWNTDTGAEVRTLSGHNGCVYSLSFRGDGKILASASGDRTVKLWDVASGERRDTLSQSLKELYSVAFSPDGKQLVAAGVDNRIRLWSVSEKGTETTNPLLEAKFGHEGAILRLVYSPDGKTLASSADDRTVKLWNTSDLSERLALPLQPDWAPGLAFVSENKGVAVGRLDGSYEIYESSSGKPAPLPRPELVRVEPRGVQRGIETRIKLVGKNLNRLTNLLFTDRRIDAKIVSTNSDSLEEQWAWVKPPEDLKRGAYEFFAASGQGESGKVKLYVDDIPQVTAGSVRTNSLELPLGLWGLHGKTGDSETYRFYAAKGQTIVFDFAAKSLGSKSDGVLTLVDERGKTLASSSGFDGNTDPFLSYTFENEGTYALQVTEQSLGASMEHFYRLTVGTLPYVTSFYPLEIGTNSTELELIGANLPETKITIAPEKVGELELPLDPEKFRTRRMLKVAVTDLPLQRETESNNNPAEATPLTVPVAVGGRFWKSDGSADADLYKFKAKRGENWVIETKAAQRGSPADTKIEILDAEGKPVERVVLQAVRNSAITFRGIDSTSPDCRVENWEEMELNQYLYFQGEVVKLFRAPQGPDSGFLFYSSNGRRRCYFDTSASAHAVEEACYIVEAHALGARLTPNGLPVFHLNYENDDDGERKLGTDSKVYFTPPADGEYVVRVTDTRGYSGERFIYSLEIRPTRPDFRLSLAGGNPVVGAGSGQPFTVSAERLDGFEGEITVEISGLPAGFFASTPLTIQAGHSFAAGTIFCDSGAAEPSGSGATGSKVTGTATIDGRSVTRESNNFGTIKRGEEPKLFVSLEPDNAKTAATGQMIAAHDRPLEITLAPGESVPAWLRIRRNGHDDLVTFTVENLPHGVIVDSIGLNGVLIPKGQNEREIFLVAAKWVPNTDRLCYAVENQAGRQTSRPVLLHVRQPGQQTVSASR